MEDGEGIEELVEVVEKRGNVERTGAMNEEGWVGCVGVYTIYDVYTLYSQHSNPKV